MDPKTTSNQQVNATTKTNVLSIIGLISAFLVPLVGLILSVIGLVQTKMRNEKGKGLAIAGIVVSLLIGLLQFIVLVVVVVALANSSIKLDSFTNASPTYTVKYPSGWTREVENTSNVNGYVFKDKVEDNSGNVYGQEEIVYVPAPPNGYTADVINAIKDSIKSKYSGTVVSYESRDTINGRDGLRMTITYNGEKGKVKAKITILKNPDGSVYTLVTQSPEQNYQKYSDAFDEIHNTFQP